MKSIYAHFYCFPLLKQRGHAFLNALTPKHACAKCTFERNRALASPSKPFVAHAVQKIAAYSFISKYATISRLFLFLRRVHLIYIRNIYCCTHAYFLLTLIVNKIL